MRRIPDQPLAVFLIHPKRGEFVCYLFESILKGKIIIGVYCHLVTVQHEVHEVDHIFCVEPATDEQKVLYNLYNAGLMLFLSLSDETKINLKWCTFHPAIMFLELFPAFVRIQMLHELLFPYIVHLKVDIKTAVQ